MEKKDKLIKVSFISVFVIFALIFLPILYSNKELYSVMEYYYAYGMLYFVVLLYVPLIANLVICYFAYKNETNRLNIFLILTLLLNVGGYLALLIYALLNPPV